MHATSIEQWRSLVEHTAALAPREPITLAITDAHGMRLAEPLVAREAAPAFPMSAMDGFALNSRELAPLIHQSCANATPLTIHVTSDIAAGAAPKGEHQPGSAARIMTGARVPNSADLVIPVELTDAQPFSLEPPRAITISAEVIARESAAFERGRHVRAIGEEIAEGEILAPPGALVTPLLIAVALPAGITQVRVIPTPRVAIVMTGDELVEQISQPDSPTAGNYSTTYVRESNGQTLAAALVELGASSTIHHAADNPHELMGLLNSVAPRHDLVLTTGGVGSGARDVVKAALSGSSTFEHVAMKPGGPQGVGRLARCDTPMVHLPGTPVGALVGFHLFVAPLLTGLSGVHEIPADHVRWASQAPKTSRGCVISPATLTIEGGRVIATEIPGPRIRPYALAHALLMRHADGRVNYIELPHRK